MITGFVLAGGKSSRMGRDKALLTVGQWLLIEVVIERIRPHVEQVFVIGNTDNSPRLRDLRVDGVLTDLKPDWGPLMGLYTGLMYSRTPLNLFIPCDMPWIDARLIERLFNTWSDGLDLIASRGPDGRLYPFPLVCHLRACRRIGALLDRRMLSLQELLRHPKARLLAVREPELLRGFTNVNTLDDYVQLHDETIVAR